MPMSEQLRDIPGSPWITSWQFGERQKAVLNITVQQYVSKLMDEPAITRAVERFEHTLRAEIEKRRIVNKQRKLGVLK